MHQKGSILIAEDDKDDQELIEIALRESGITNKIVFFSNGEEGLDLIHGMLESPVLILCDVEMPVMDGIEFKMHIDSDPKLSSYNIPFVFFTTSSYKLRSNAAFSQITKQGLFEKPSDFNEFKKILKLIIEYWMANKVG